MTSQAVMKRYLTAVSKTEEYANNTTIQNLAIGIANFKKLEKKQQAELNVLIEGAYNKLQAKGFSVKKTPTRTTTTRKTRTTSQGGLKAILAELKKKLGSEKFKEATTGTDIQKDIKIPALKKGKRIVRKKGYTSNLYGTFKNKVGSVYYESRANRMDVNQPSQTRKYKLADGGSIGNKVYNEMYGVGNSKYVVNFHDGEKTHKDGSPFFDIRIFKNKIEKDNFVKDLKSKGFIYKYAKGGNVERGSAHIYITKTNGEYKVYHGSDVTLRKNAKPLYTSENNPEGTWDKIWSTLRGSKMADGGNTSKLTEAEREQAEREIREAWEGKNIDDYVMYSDKFAKGGRLSNAEMSKTKIKDWYKKNYKTDELGDEINPNITFDDVIVGILNGREIYSLIGVRDSVVRERLFSKLSKLQGRYENYANDLYRKYGDKNLESFAKGGTTKRIKRRSC
jgi:hypothetical protein